MNDNTGTPRRTRVVMRFYSGDRFRHAYRAADFFDRRRDQVHPVCHDDAFASMLAHPKDMLAKIPFTDLGGPFCGCTRCEQWGHRISHEVFDEDEVTAAHETPARPARSGPETARRTS